MKKSLLITSLVLSFSTTGMFAAAVAEPVPAPAAPTQNTPVKAAKHKHKRHAKHHKKHEDTTPSVTK